MTTKDNGWREKVKNLFYKFHDLGFAYPEGLRVGVEKIIREAELRAKIEVLEELIDIDCITGKEDFIVNMTKEKLKDLTQQLNK